MSETIICELDGHVAIVRLNRPERLNALRPQDLDLLSATMRKTVEEGARCVLITGEGRAFCSGADLGESELANLGARLGEIVADHYAPLAQTLAELEVPVVSAVNGPAAGAGVSIALGADIVVAARSAYFLLAFANIGLVPDAGATWLVAQSVGRAKALEMALLAERLTAQDAADVGLIARVVNDETLMETALTLARRLAAMPTIALGLIRSQVKHALAGRLEDSLSLEAHNQGLAGRTADFGEGVDAFLARRIPDFTGR